jgi:hypothetical protein
MAAAWIMERSGENVREQWDSYRSEWRDWESLGPPDFGCELRAVGPANLDVFGRDVDYPFEDDNDMMPFAHEMCFALRSGQLSATGVSRARKVRVPISKIVWRGPFQGAERKTRPEAIYAVDTDFVSYDEVQVPRDEVIGIWAPTSPTTVDERIPTVTSAPTLPPGFDRPDWIAEHVLAWLGHPNLAELRALELADPKRPDWYGRIYRRGCIDARSETRLREALITEKLIPMKGENPVGRGGYWRDKSILNTRGIWFRSDHVMQLWPAQGDEPVQTIETNPRDEDETISDAKSSSQKQIQSAHDGSRDNLKQGSARYSKKKWVKPFKRERVMAAIRQDIKNRTHTIEELNGMKQESLGELYGVGRTLATAVLRNIMSEVDGNYNCGK